MLSVQACGTRRTDMRALGYLAAAAAGAAVAAGGRYVYDTYYADKPKKRTRKK